MEELIGLYIFNRQRNGIWFNKTQFSSQVHIINLLQDSKFHHFKPVMDTYIESHFAGALAYR